MRAPILRLFDVLIGIEWFTATHLLPRLPRKLKIRLRQMKADIDIAMRLEKDIVLDVEVTPTRPDEC